MTFTFWKEVQGRGGGAENGSQGFNKLTVSQPGRAAVLFHSLDSSWSPQNHSAGLGKQRGDILGAFIFHSELLYPAKKYLLQGSERSLQARNMEPLKSGLDGDFEDKVNCVFLLTK